MENSKWKFILFSFLYETIAINLLYNFPDALQPIACFFSFFVFLPVLAHKTTCQLLTTITAATLAVLKVLKPLKGRVVGCCSQSFPYYSFYSCCSFVTLSASVAYWLTRSKLLNRTTPVAFPIRALHFTFQLTPAVKRRIRCSPLRTGPRIVSDHSDQTALWGDRISAVKRWPSRSLILPWTCKPSALPFVKYSALLSQLARLLSLQAVWQASGCCRLRSSYAIRFTIECERPNVKWFNFILSWSAASCRVPFPTNSCMKLLCS